MSLSPIVRTHRDAILSLAARHGAHNVRVFGSMSRDAATADSDLDLLVEFEKGRSLYDQVGLIQDLEDLLGVPVDVVSQAALFPSIRVRVLDEAVAL